MKIIKTLVDALAVPLTRESLKHNPNERGTNIPSGVYLDLACHDSGCVLFRATGGNDTHQGGIEIAAGSWSAMKKLYDEKQVDTVYRYYIRIPNGTCYPADYTGKVRGPTFVEAIKAGLAQISDVDDWVEAWHNGAGNDDQRLQDYLGFDDTLYGEWVRKGDCVLQGLN